MYRFRIRTIFTKVNEIFYLEMKKHSSVRNTVLMRVVNLGCTLYTVIKKKEEQTFPVDVEV